MAAGNRKEYELLFKLQAALGGNFNSSFKTANTTVKSLQNSLTKINAAQSKISGYQKQSEAIQQNKDKLTLLKEEHKRLQAEMKATQSPSEALRQKLAKNEAQISKTTEKIKEQEIQLNVLNADLKKSGINTDNLTGSNEKLQKSYERIKKSQENIAKINEAQQKNSAAISKTKGQLGGTVGAAAVIAAAIYAGPVNAAQSFEAQMSTVQAISGAMPEDMAKLSAAAKEAGRTTKFSATESGQALEYMSMAGWKTAQMVAGLPGIMSLAAASGEQLASVSDIVTDALSAFKMQAEDAGHFSDVLAAASSNSNTNVAMLGESFKYVAPVAGALNYSVEDVSMALGIMANNGIKGSTAGTSLKNMLSNLAKPTDKMATMMSKLNISLTDGAGQMKPLNALMTEMRGSFAGLSEAEKAAAASTLAGKEGMAGLLAIVNTSDADFNKLTEAINNADGAAEKMAATRIDNYSGQITLCKSAIESLNIAIGEAILPTITEAFKHITAVISKIAEFAEANPELTKTILKVSAALVGIKLAGLGAKLAFLEVKGGVLTVLKGFETFKGGLEIVNSGILGIPGKASKAFGPIGKLTNKVFGKTFGKAFGAIGGMARKAFSPISKIASKAFGPIMGIATKIMGPVGRIFGLFGSLLGPILPAMAAIMGIIVAVQILTGNLDKIREVVGNIFGEGGLKAFDSVVDVMANIGNTIKGIFGEENLGQAREKINELFGEKGVAVFNGAIQVLRSVGSAFMTIWNTINTYVTPMVQQLFDYVVNVVLPVVGEKFAEWAPSISAIITGIAEGISTTIQVVMEIINFAMPVIKAIFENGFSAIGTIIGSVLGVFEGVIQTIKGVFTGDFSSALEGIKKVFKNIFEGIKAVCMAPINAIKDGLTGIINKIRGVKDAKIEGPTDITTGKKVSGFAKGTNYTPSTFVAGEDGPELITGAAGRKVFTAAQTQKIFKNINTPERSLPIASGTMQNNNKVEFNYTPTIIVDGSRPNDLEEKLEANNEKMFTKFKQFMKNQKEDERRLEYA